MRAIYFSSFLILISATGFSDIVYGPDNNQVKRQTSSSNHQYKKTLFANRGYNSTTFENDVILARSRKISG